MTWGAVAGAAVSVVGGAIAADSAGGAAGAMSGGSEQAQMMQMMAAAQMRQDLQPWTSAGGAAQSRLNQFLGLGGVGSGGRTSLGLSTGLTPDQVRQQLLSRFTRQSTAANAAPMYRTGAEVVAALGAQGAHDYFQNQNTQSSRTSVAPLFGNTPNGANVLMGGGNSADGVHGDTWEMPGQAQGPASTIDEEGLNAAISKYYEEQDAQNRAAESDPAYGSLLRAYRNGEEFSFTGDDLKTDPGYQFGLNQGTQGIERGQAARGNFLSGAAMKELARFNEDYAGTKFNEGFNRAQSTWNTNQTAYDNNRSRIYSFLTGVSTLGQNSAAQVGAGNQQAANQMSSNALATGNVNAASSIARGNALQSGLNQAVNGINSAGGWNNLLGSQGSGYSGSTGYSGGQDPLGNMINANGWTG